MTSVSVLAAGGEPRADAVVVLTEPGERGVRVVPGGAAGDDALGGRLDDALRVLNARGRAGEVLAIPTLHDGVALVVATGLGSTAIPGGRDEAVRRAVGAAVRDLAGRPAVRRVHLAADVDPGAAAEGAAFGAYSFTTYKSDAPRPSLRTVTITGDAAARRAARAAAIVGEAVAHARDWINTPPNDLYPASFADAAAALGREHGLEVEVLDERALRRGRYGGIVAVGQGSVQPPRLVRLSYRPARARAHLAVVGKGITFDSGGLNLKTSGMAAMKSDMSGAAAAIAAVVAIARLKLPIAATATVPMAENMPSGSAYRPSDVIRMRDGSTVEIANTDAEGRMVLADAINRAAEDDPDHLIEISTLTGAQLVALGTQVTGVMGEPAWRDTVATLASAAGEAAWAMPMPDETRTGLDSSVADLANVTPDRWAGMLVGGRFLGEFVPDGLPWVHLDIAGPAFNGGRAHGYTPVGGTGAGVRTILAAARSLAQ